MKPTIALFTAACALIGAAGNAETVAFAGDGTTVILQDDRTWAHSDTTPRPQHPWVQAACTVYADRAIAQERTNRAEGCGQFGTAWHGSYGAHYLWCLTAERQTPFAEIAGREQALSACTSQAAGCQRLVEIAAEYRGLSAEYGCGFTGFPWDLAPGELEGWCLGLDPDGLGQATAVFVSDLGGCLGQVDVLPGQ